MRINRMKFFLILLTIILLPISVFAKEKITLELDKTDLEVGENVTVIAKLPTDTKLYALTAVLSYDSSVFEQIDYTDFNLLDDAIDVVYNTNNNKFGIINKSGEIKEELFRVTLKVKENANVGNTSISLTNISSSDGDNTVSFEETSTKVLVTRDATKDEVIQNNPEKEVEHADIKEEKIKSFSTMPIMICLSIVILLLIICAVINKKENKNKPFVILTSLAVLFLAVLISLFIVNNNKKDVNNDGKENYEDAKEIMKYLIDIEGTKSSSDSTNQNSNNNNSNHSNKGKFDYDVNNDGKVDLDDVSSSTQHVTEDIKYEVSLKEKEQEFYVNKGNITLEFEANVTNNEKIKEVNIDGKYYPVVYNNVYSVTLNTPSTSGVHIFKISKVKLVNNKEVDTKLEIKREILKDEPYVDMFNFDDKEKTLTFKLEDKEKSFIEGNIIIEDKNGVEVVNKKISNDNNIKYDFKIGEKYTVMIFVTYDLDTNEFTNITGQMNRVENKAIYSHILSIDTNYNFKITNINISDAIEKGEKPTITFESTNSKGYTVEYIEIDGVKYKVSPKYEKNKYIVVLDNINTDNYGKYHIDIDKVEMNNYKVFERDIDYKSNTLSYTVLKKAPTVENITLDVNKDEEEVIVNYKVIDNDKTLNSLNLYLVDTNNNVVANMDSLEAGNKQILSYSGNISGGYRVKFLANYNLGTDRHNYTDVNLGEKGVLTQSDVVITKVEVGLNNNKTNPYPTKNQQKYQIRYTISLSENIINKYNRFAGVTINGINFDGGSNTVDKNGIATTTISFTVPSSSGIVDLRVDRVKLASESYQGVSQAFFTVEPYTTQIDVLKDKPSIEDLEIVDEDYDNGNVTFKFKVIDDKGGFERGSVSLDGQVKDITLKDNLVTFTNITKDKQFNLLFTSDFDLDTNTLDEDTNLNSYKNEKIYEVSYGLYSNDKYDKINIIDLSTLSENKNYFEKNEQIKLNFNVVKPDIDFEIDKIIIEGNEYNVLKTNDGYTTTIPGYLTSGIKEIKIEEIILNNGKKITLNTPASIKIEVLKDIVSVYDFKYEINDDKIKLNLSLKDDDKSIIGDAKDYVNVNIYNEKGQLLYSLPYNNEIEFNRADNLLRYYIDVSATYDRDISRKNDNYYENMKLLDEVVSIDKNYIEIKDIIDVTLYKEEENKTTAVEEVDINDLQDNLDNYFVKISMTNMPSIHGKITKILNENNRLILILDYEYTVKQNSKEKQDLRIDFGQIKDGKVINEARPETMEQLIERITKNPSSHVILTRDYDMSEIKVNTNAYFDVEFEGIFDGNGHTIKNLDRPLFKIVRGTVENLKIENVTLPSGEGTNGTLANTTYGANIKNILVNAVSKSNSTTATGGLIGDANNTIIENCRVTNVNFNLNYLAQQNGALVGKLNNSTIKNCYASGKINGGYNFIGGLVGDGFGGSVITNSYAKVTLTGNGYNTTSAFAGSYRGNLTIKNSISLSNGFYYSFSGNLEKSENNYFVNNGKSGSEHPSLTKVEINDVNEKLFKEDLKFDNDIWKLSNISYDNLPIFNFEKVTKINVEEVGNDYDESKELLYNNLMLLMPYYDSSKIVSSAKNISDNTLLSKQEIKHIIPIDENGNVVTYLTTENQTKIKKIKIVFNNNETEEYDVRYDKTYDMIASYRISDLMIDYTYNHYVLDSNSQLVNNLTNYLTDLTYEDNLDKLTTSTDSRIYSEFYNDVTKKELKQFVLKYLSNSNYAVTSSNEAISDYLEREIKSDKKLEKMLYVYNYFRRFYDVEIDGIKLYDFMLFNSQGFSDSMTPYSIAQMYLNNKDSFATNKTNDAYRDLLSKYTGYTTIPELLEYLVKVLSNEDPADWYASQFKGYLIELNVDNRPDIEYRLWEHIKTQDKNTKVNWFNYALPIITLPENAAYIISTPTQFVIGAQRTYMNDPYNESDRAVFLEKVKTYTTRMKEYYTTAASIIEDKDIFNNIHTIQIDKRFAYENGVLTFQSPYSTQEPFHKNFNEVIGQWAYPDGNAATANGAYIIWRAEGVLDGEWTYHTWSHETAHNMDARLFLKDNGRRFDAGGEDYADGNLNQIFNDHDIVMNISMHFQDKDNIAANLEPSRIDSKEEIYDFYNKLFDTVYIMDYLEGQAFLKLTPEEQSKLAVQVSYPRETEELHEGEEYLKRQHTVYQEISTEEFEKMNLSSMKDLYTNHLVMYPGVIYTTLTTNRYGGENILKVRWYQPHNDLGRPDSYSIKWWAYEMLGYAGYDDGYIEYYSNINSIKKNVYQVRNTVPGMYEVDYKTDLMALQKITNQSDMTFEKYRLGRFDKVEQNLTNIQVINVNEYFNKFYDALKKDAEAVKKAQDEALKLYPGDTKEMIDKRNSYVINSKAKELTNSSAVRKELYFELKNGTNDFIGDVYNSTNKQVVNPFTIPSN